MKTILWMKTDSANRLKCGTAGRCKLRMNPKRNTASKVQGKARTSWVGYKVQVAESVGEEGTANFLTSIVTQESNRERRCGITRDFAQAKRDGLGSA